MTLAPRIPRTRPLGTVGLGWRREMHGWDAARLAADFFEVVTENWLRRDRAPLHALRALGRPLALHGVSLNLGGHSPIDAAFVRSIGALMDELGVQHCSDHLAASGDAHQLHDLFPIPTTRAEAVRVADRIRRVQDLLGRRIAVENATWYTNVGDLPEAVFIAEVLARADCQLLLDLNNVAVNHKNHGGDGPEAFVARLDLGRVSYLHVAGHEWDERFGLHLDTHSAPVEPATARLARELAERHGLAVLLEWDHDISDPDTLNQELACLKPSTATCAA